MRGMRSSLGVALAVVSSLLLLALVAELYYIFGWKKRCNSKLKLSSVFFCFKTAAPIPVIPMMHHSGSGADPALAGVTVDDVPHGCFKGGAPSVPVPVPVPVAVPVSIPVPRTGEADLQIDAELMRLHSLAGPPRFLFTIKEETREDLLRESDDGRGRSRSRLGDLLLHCTDSPFLTPLSSPPLPLLQGRSKSLGVNLDSLKKLGFNPLFESMTSPSVVLSRSPPPKLKFLQEAEEKLQRKLSLLEASMPHPNTGLPSSLAIQTQK